VLAVLTGIYVLATIVLVLLSYRQFRFALALERQRNRPVVSIDLQPDGPFLNLAVKNFGLTSAADVKIEVTPQIRAIHGKRADKSWEESKPIPFLSNGIVMLPPGKEIKGLVGFRTHVRQHNPEMIFRGTISYSDAPGRTKYFESFVIDLSAEEGLAHLQTRTLHDIAKTLDEVRDALHNLGTGYTTPLVRIISEEEYEKKELALEEEALRQAGRQESGETDRPQAESRES